MSSLRRDLIERRLWPVAILLLIGVIAVPVLLLKRSSPSGTPVPLPPAVSVANAAAASPAASASAPASGSAPAKATAKATATATATAGGSRTAHISRDPFGGGAAQTSTTSTAAAAPSGTSHGSTGTTAVAMVSPSPSASSSSAGSSAASATSAPTATHAAAPTVTVAAPPARTNTAAPTSTTPEARPAAVVPVQSWTTYSVSVRYGPTAAASLRRDIARLEPLPSASHPAAMFMGVTAHGHQAVFALGAAVRQHAGPGICRVDRAHCSEILLGAGQTEQLTLPTASGGTRSVLLRVARIASTVTHSHAAALAAFDRHSAVGLCEVVLAAPMFYNSTTGTLSSVAPLACAGHTGAVPFQTPAFGS